MTLTSGCSLCGDEMRRTQRSFLERLRFIAIYTCRSCGSKEGVSRLHALKISRYARCPECHSTRLRVLKRRDRIDRFIRNPFRLAQSILGARLYHCPGCRLQFHDLRYLEKGTNGIESSRVADS